MNLSLFSEDNKKMEKEKKKEDETIREAIQSGFSKSLLKSALQKAIRRGENEKSLRCAKSFIDQDSKDFLRRLPIIILEDVILHPNFDEATQLIKKVSRKDGWLSNDEKSFILKIINDLSLCEWRDDFVAEENVVVNEELKEANKHFYPSGLNEKEQWLVDAIKYRSIIGGMKGDINLLQKMTKLWWYRFTTSWSADHLKQYFTQEDISYESIQYANENDLMLETVDFHCSPIINILLKKDWAIKMAEENYPNKEPKDVLTDVMWCLRSGVNYKKQIGNKQPRDWFKDGFQNYSQDDVEKYQKMYEKIKNEVDNISSWFINVQKKEN